MSTQTWLPAGDSSARNAWTALGGGSKYVEVDDAVGSPDDNSTYVSSATEDAEQAFTLPSRSLSVASISNVTITARFKRNPSEYPGCQISALVGGTAYRNSAVTPDSGGTWQDFTYSMDTNPKSGAAWTQNDVNGSGANALTEIGVRLTAQSVTLYCTQIYVTVTYTAASEAAYSSLPTLGVG